MPVVFWGTITLALLGVGIPLAFGSIALGLILCSLALVTGGLTIRKWALEHSVSSAAEPSPPAPAPLLSPRGPGLSQTMRDAQQEMLRQSLKELLGSASAEGHKLYRNDPTVEEAGDWGIRVRDMIDAALGSGETALFMSNAGQVFYSGGTTSQQRWIDGRLRRLDELIPRVDSASVKVDFNPQEWE